ncbi:membrane protein [Sulfodiicoccus acidiphilus]|uniref:Membrane protein n=1 Tax=Sulfodiicoccus acidiphilus TaxID=1670455 RepID=A0A348B4H7_9CREN|nr:DUF1634 domain-containing protein [Sulfodiicoccus acidiphilus]BBD73079.1 membrane protein [Sulfodiicoccus acidiphilus]GGU05269.1 membrane protein [Sulfodiicoccus acidiphilus]
MNLERVVSLTLRTGVILSSALVIGGLVLFYVEGRNTTISSSYFNLSRMAQGLLHLDPLAIIMLGVAVLVATPVIRVLELGINYVAADRDRLYVALSFAVLALMLIGILLLPHVV